MIWVNAYWMPLGGSFTLEFSIVHLWAENPSQFLPEEFASDTKNRRPKDRILKQGKKKDKAKQVKTQISYTKIHSLGLNIRISKSVYQNAFW